MLVRLAFSARRVEASRLSAELAGLLVAIVSATSSMGALAEAAEAGVPAFEVWGWTMLARGQSKAGDWTKWRKVVVTGALGLGLIIQNLEHL